MGHIDNETGECSQIKAKAINLMVAIAVHIAVLLVFIFLGFFTSIMVFSILSFFMNTDIIPMFVLFIPPVLDVGYFIFAIITKEIVIKID